MNRAWAPLIGEALRSPVEPAPVRARKVRPRERGLTKAELTAPGTRSALLTFTWERGEVRGIDPGPSSSTVTEPL